MLFFFLVYSIAHIHGFLIDSNTAAAHGGQITDQHYIALFGEIAQEKHARRQILQFVEQLQKELDSTRQEVNILIKQRNDECKESDISKLKMDNSILNQTTKQLISTNIILRQTMENLRQNYMQLRNKIEMLKQLNSKADYWKININNTLLEDKLIILRNATSTFKDKLFAFKNSKAGHDLEILQKVQNEKSYLQTEINVIIRNVNDLKRISNARIQDFMAFIKETANIKSKTDEVQNSYMAAKHIITDISKKTNATRGDLMSWKYISNQAIDMKEVGVSVCGGSGGVYRSDNVITYSNSKSAVGVKDTLQLQRSGYFTTEKDGLYIISATLMSYTSQAYGYIYKNNSPLSFVYVANKSPESWTYTGTAVVSVMLNRGDKIGVKTGKDMHIYGPGSCLAVIKVK